MGADPVKKEERAGGGRRRGLFITFEGCEGSGKSTQARILGERLAGAGQRVVMTREPGGTPGAESIRELTLVGEADRWPPMAELLLMYAARADHLEKVIRPALAGGETVISDRFADSSMAYQGWGRKIGVEPIAALDQIVLGATIPDLTIMLDVPAEVGLRRVSDRGETDRFETMHLEFHKTLRQAYLQIAANNPQRCVVVRGDGEPAEIASKIWRAVQDRLGPI